MIIDSRQKGIVQAPQPAQKAADDGQERLRLIADTVPLLIRFCGPDGRWVFFNRHWLASTGRTLERELGCGWIEGVHPDDLSRCLETCSSALNACRPFQVSYRLRLADGDYHGIVEAGLPMFEPEGRFAGLVCMGTAGPPPEPKEAALPEAREAPAAESGKACEESEQRFRAFMDHSPALAFMKDAQGRYVYGNRAFERLFGARVLGKTDFDFLPEDTAKQLQYNDLLVLAMGEPRQFVEAVPTPDGTPHDWLVVKFPFRDAQGAGYVGGMAVDVTERVQAERALRESERRFHALARISPVGIFRADPAGSCVYVNDRWCEIAGLTAGEALGEGWARSLHPEDRERVIGQWYRAVAGKRLFAAEYRVLRPDGAITWVFGQAIPEEGPEKRAVGYVGTITDITEQKRSQEQLRALSPHLQDTLETERARIAQEIHDELGALLTAIKMDLSFCLEEAGGTKGFLSGKLYEAMTRVDTAVQAVRKIAAGLRPSILDDFGLWAAIEWQAQDFQARTGIPCELSMNVLHVPLRRERATAVFRILQEALTNVARHARASRVSITVQTRGNDLRVEVTDNGKGIRSEQVHDPKSFGLRGMFERAAALGGEVQISGAPGQGTCVAVRVPLDEAKDERS